jgi:hypothetical protein
VKQTKQASDQQTKNRTYFLGTEERIMKTLIIICMTLAICSLSYGGLTIDVFASSAPNVYGSPSWNGYVANALYALENGLSSYGDRQTNPTGYEQAPDVIDPWEIAVTTFKSWRGTINPTGAFANELGNRIHFGLHVYGDGSTRFTLEDLIFELHSSDPGNTLYFAGDFIGSSYSTTRYGIDWGADRTKGGGDDIVYTSGNGTTLVDELVYVGVGNAWWPAGDWPDKGVGNPQAAMDDYFAWILSEQPIDVTCTYSILSYSGSDTVRVIPEPATMALLALGGLVLRKRR